MSLGNLFYYRPGTESRSHVIECDVCVYGGNAAGIMAAIQIHRAGYRAVVVEFGSYIGGLTTGGLGATDIGNKQAIGGLAREFYRELGKYYGEEESWTFEPHAAAETLSRLAEEAGVPVYFRQALRAVRKKDTEIREIEMEDGTIYRARRFIDASYEGDLMAMAGVSYTVGREGNQAYGETFNGIHYGHPNHNFLRFVDPYKIAGDPGSGLCEGITEDDSGLQGEGDRRLQAFNFRLCLTDREDICTPFPCPPNYDPERYVLLSRYLKTGVWDALYLSKPLPNGKTDTNNFGAFSTDHIGQNHDWPEACYSRREEIFQDHVSYQMGLLYFLAHDSSVPAWIREELKGWGLAKDEFQSTGGWPHTLYVREARRMVSDYVMTEHHAVGRVVVEDAIGLAAYQMDSHHCRRVVRGGRVCNEGNVEIGGFGPYPISYRSICPREVECTNLLVPWCLSASHIAFGSIRMEPVGMVLGQSAAIAALLSIEGERPVQSIEMASFQERLRKAGQVIDAPEKLWIRGINAYRQRR